MLVFEAAKEETEFVVDSDETCFFCLNKVSLEPRSVPTLRHSLQYLSHYLKLDVKNAFEGKGLIPPQLLAKVEKSSLKVVLCAECASLSEQFSELYRKLEKIKMDMNFCLSRIENKLANADAEEQGGMLDSDKRLEILEALRTQALQKCAMMSRSADPRIKLQTTVQSMSPPIEIKCNRCDEAFISKALLRKHWQLEHSTVASSETDARPISHDGEMEIEELIDISAAGAYENSSNDYSKLETDVHNQRPILITIGDTDVEVIEETLSSDDDSDSLTSSNFNRRKSEIQLRKADDVEKADSSPIIITPSKDFEHFERTYKCPSCEMEFNQWSLYDRHRIDAHTDRSKCRNCNKAFRFKANLQKHQQTCRQTQEEIQFQLGEHERDLLPKHRRVPNVQHQEMSSPHDNDISIVTPGPTESDHPYLTRTYVENIGILLPITIVPLSSEEDQHVAPAAERPGLEFMNNQNQTPGPSSGRKNLTGGSGSIKCNHCGEMFPSLASLEQHQIAVQQEMSQFECDICHKRFVTSKECALHRYTHTVPSINKDGNEKQNCDLCGKELNSLVALRRHFEVVHLKVRNFACPTCGKKFNRANGVKQHMECVHLGIRFPCVNPGCNKICSDRTAVRKHRKVCPFNSSTNSTPNSKQPTNDLANDVEGDSTNFVKEEQRNAVESSENMSVDEQFILPN